MANFNFCEDTYQRAHKIMEDLAKIAESKIEPKSYGLMQLCDTYANVSIYEAIPEENLYLGVTDGALTQIGAMYSYEARYNKKDIRLITISEPSIIMPDGRRKMSIKDKSHLFHEIIHHMDYMDGLVFDEEARTTTVNITTYDVVMNVNTFVEQRAYFYAHVYEMRSRLTYKILKSIKALKPFIGGMSKKHLTIYDLMIPSNQESHTRRINQLVAAEYR